MSAKIVQMVDSYLFGIDLETGEIDRRKALAVGKTFVTVGEDKLECPGGFGLKWKKNLKKDQVFINVVNFEGKEKVVCSLCQVAFVNQPDDALMLVCENCEKRLTEKEEEK